MRIKELFNEKAQSEWSSLYMLLVLIIAALLLILIVKPMFSNAQKTVTPIKNQLTPTK